MGFLKLELNARTEKVVVRDSHIDKKLPKEYQIDVNSNRTTNLYNNAEAQILKCILLNECVKE